MIKLPIICRICGQPVKCSKECNGYEDHIAENRPEYSLCYCYKCLNKLSRSQYWDSAYFNIKMKYCYKGILDENEYNNLVDSYSKFFIKYLVASEL